VRMMDSGEFMSVGYVKSRNGEAEMGNSDRLVSVACTGMYALCRQVAGGPVSPLWLVLERQEVKISCVEFWLLNVRLVSALCERRYGLEANERAVPTHPKSKI
jgi:hypothetical protein